MIKQYFGKYRAKVTNVSDTEFRGRIRVLCPKVLGDYESNWCEPCIPFAYEHGGDFHIPKVGDFVWVEFEEGDSNKPIWVGSLWTINNTPLQEPYTVDKRVIEFDGARVEMTASDILITVGNSKINLNKSGTIDIIGSSAITVNGSTINLN